MKKFILAASMAALSCANGFAAFVQCAPSQGSVVSGGVIQTDPVFTCSPSALAGNIAGDGQNVIGIQLAVAVSSAQTGGQTSTVHSVSVTMSNNAGLSNVSPNPIVLSFTSSGVTGAGSANTGDIAAPNSLVVAIDEFGAFTVTMSGATFGGNPLPANATASVYYQATTQAIPPSGVPEPTSMALLGSALIGLGLVARGKRS